jgi:hypothetical protein
VCVQEPHTKGHLPSVCDESKTGSEQTKFQVTAYVLPFNRDNSPLNLHKSVRSRDDFTLSRDALPLNYHNCTLYVIGPVVALHAPVQKKSQASPVPSLLLILLSPLFLVRLLEGAKEPHAKGHSPSVCVI